MTDADLLAELRDQVQSLTVSYTDMKTERDSLRDEMKQLRVAASDALTQLMAAESTIAQLKAEIERLTSGLRPC